MLAIGRRQPYDDTARFEKPPAQILKRGNRPDASSLGSTGEQSAISALARFRGLASTNANLQASSELTNRARHALMSEESVLPRSIGCCRSS